MMLDREAIKSIETILANGYDVEIRKTKYGVTIASIGKKVVYKGNSTDESVSAIEPKRG